MLTEGFIPTNVRQRKDVLCCPEYTIEVIQRWNLGTYKSHFSLTRVHVGMITLSLSDVFEQNCDDSFLFFLDALEGSLVVGGRLDWMASRGPYIFTILWLLNHSSKNNKIWKRDELTSKTLKETNKRNWIYLTSFSNLEKRVRNQHQAFLVSPFQDSELFL